MTGTTTTLTSTQNPSIFGRSVIFTARVTASDPNSMPTGIVEFFDGIAQIGTTIISNGEASFGTSSLEIGVRHNITAKYMGGGSFLPSSSDALIQVVKQAPRGSNGYLVLNDGVMPDGKIGIKDFSSFEVGLKCSQYAISLDGSRSLGTAVFSKTLRRIAPSKNPVRSAKRLVSEYAGCYEASILRKRILAISRMRVSINGEEFRFRLPQ